MVVHFRYSTQWIKIRDGFKGILYFLMGSVEGRERNPPTAVIVSRRIIIEKTSKSRKTPALIKQPQCYLTICTIAESIHFKCHF